MKCRTNLKVFRIKHHLTQAQMAEKIGHSRPAYTAIETGKRDGRAYFWNELQRAFNIPDDEMWELMQIEEIEQ